MLYRLVMSAMILAITSDALADAPLQIQQVGSGIVCDDAEIADQYGRAFKKSQAHGWVQFSVQYGRDRRLRSRVFTENLPFCYVVEFSFVFSAYNEEKGYWNDSREETIESFDSNGWQVEVRREVISRFFIPIASVAPEFRERNLGRHPRGQNWFIPLAGR